MLGLSCTSGTGNHLLYSNEFCLRLFCTILDFSVFLLGPFLQITGWKFIMTLMQIPRMMTEAAPFGFFIVCCSFSCIKCLFLHSRFLWWNKISFLVVEQNFSSHLLKGLHVGLFFCCLYKSIFFLSSDSLFFYNCHSVFVMTQVDLLCTLLHILHY